MKVELEAMEMINEDWLGFLNFCISEMGERSERKTYRDKTDIFLLKLLKKAVTELFDTFLFKDGSDYPGFDEEMLIHIANYCMMLYTNNKRNAGVTA